jgi:hypothetical protein
MRWLIAITAAVFLHPSSWADDSQNPESAYTRAWLGALITGQDFAPQSFSMFWSTAPPEQQAIAIGHIVSTGANPISAGIGQLAIGDQVKPIPRGDDEPVTTTLGTGYPALFAGNLPFKPSNFKIPDKGSGQGGAAGGMGGGMGGGAASDGRPGTLENPGPNPTPDSFQKLSSTDGLPLLTTALSLGQPDTADSVAITLNSKDGPNTLSADIPNDGWWLYTIGEVKQNPDGSYTSNNPILNELTGVNPPYMADNIRHISLNPPGPTVPEPTTIGLSILGLAGLAVSRLRRFCRKSTKSS